MNKPETAFNLHPTTLIIGKVLLEPPFRTYEGCMLREFTGGGLAILPVAIPLCTAHK